MKTETQILNGLAITVVIAAEAHALRRLHDGVEMGARIALGIDHSTGVPREDKPEYYEEIPVATGNGDAQA